MSEEMKMGDVFELPMLCEDGDGFLYSKDLRYVISFDDTDVNCNQQKVAVANAINNHDTLTEQVRQLTGDYQSLELQARQWLNGYKEFDAQNKDLREQVRQLRKKEEKLNLYEALTGNCWDLVCVSYSHGDDSSYEWQVIGHYMSKPYKRVLGYTSNEDSPHEAIEHALETTKDSVYDYLYEFKD